MGFGIKELLIILVIVILLFGTKKLKSLGSDLGGAIKGFRQSVNDNEENADDEKPELTGDKTEKPATDNKKTSDENSSH